MIILLAMSENVRNIMMLAGVLLLVAIFMLNIVRRARRGGVGSARGPRGEQLTAQERIERARQVDGTKNDLRSMMVELEELSREFSAKLDAKSVQLEKQIREADERIAELQRLVETGAPGRGGRKAAQRTKPVTPAASGLADDLDSPAAPNQPTLVRGEGDPLTANVYQLADAGHDAGEIAGKLGEHVGKVELILALRQA